MRKRKNIVVSKGNLAYEKIEAYIQALIDRGKLKEGDRILPERELGRMFNASTITVRRAMERFLQAGVLEKLQGKGTFVRKLKKGSLTNNIAVAYCYNQFGIFSDSFYSSIITGIEEQARTFEKNLVFTCLVRGSNEDPGSVLLEQCNNVDGFLIIDLWPSVFKRIEKTVRTLSKPVVVLNDEYAWQGAVDSVVTDSRENTRMAVQFLIDRGHTRIACAYMSPKDGAHPNHTARVEAFKETLRANRIEPEGALIQPMQEDTSDRLLEMFLDRPDPATALFCTASYLVRAVLYPQAKKNKIRIPQDLTIIGYDDTPECETLSPPLTALANPLEEMGRLGMQKVIERVSEEGGDTATRYGISLPGRLMERGSHRKIK